MKSKSPQAPVADIRRQSNDTYIGSFQQERAVEQARIAYLNRRFAPHIAAAAAPLIFGGAR